MNVNVVLSISLVIVGACVGIFIWMNQSGLGTDDIALVEACRKSNQNQVIGTDPETGDDISFCDELERQGANWDYWVPCAAGADRGLTFRQLFDAWSADEKECQDEVNSIDPVGFIPDCECEEGDCDTVCPDVADYSGAKPANPPVTCGTNIKALINDVCPAARRLDEYTEEELEQRRLALGGGSHWSTSAMFVLGFSYGPCSIDGGFLVKGPTADDAQCGGNSGNLIDPDAPGGTVSFVPFTGGQRGCGAHLNPNGGSMYARDTNNWLMNGCWNHDYCLVGDGTYNYRTDNANGVCGAKCETCEANGVYYEWGYQTQPGFSCDAHLGSAALKCITGEIGWGWNKGRACRGRSWWRVCFDYHYWGPIWLSCDDSTVASTLVATAMALRNTDAGCGV